MISGLIHWNWQLDGWIVVAGMLCAIASSLLGNFLVLRRMSMLGDAISHAVLPGLAAAFMISGARNSMPMFLGAVIVGVLTAFFTEWIRGVGRVDEGASMGVVFTSLFALGLVMIVQAADYVDLDPGCVLYGAIEMTPLDTVWISGFEIPRAVAVLSVVVLINAAFVILFFKELKLSSFDPALATTTGFNARFLHYLLMVLVAITAVASFESVGNILVVAMFVVPPATAYMLTDRLTPMILISLVLAMLSAIFGHLSALVVPGWFGLKSTTTAGMMAVVAGLFLTVAVFFSPRHGVFVKRIRRKILSISILADDIVALLYRVDERQPGVTLNEGRMKALLFSDSLSLRAVLSWLQRRGQITRNENGYTLTDSGRLRASGLVRSHRLWEQYLVSLAGVDSDRIHDKAEQLEHFTDQLMRDRLNQATNLPTIDPHGSPIPKE